jgi:hypothetical protein
MPSVASPHPRYQQSFLALVQEIIEAGEDEHWSGLTIFREETHTVEELADPDTFAAFARDLGIDPALLTCDDTNTGSRRVIESNGGVFEDKRRDKLRFWVPTSS